MRRTSLVPIFGGVLALAAALTSTHTTHAFCGFYVDEGGKTLANDATQVVLMRSGTKTVLSMQNDYRGPPDHFAMVVPVPVVLQKDQVKTLPKPLLDKVERLDAPRLVEYWEQDPCAPAYPESIGLGNIGTLGHGSGMGNGQGFGAGHVTVEAQFTVGEYEIVILSATDSSALDGWLKANKYHIPDGAEPLLRPYVTAGMKFFVAKVDATKLKFEDGHAALSPLRFHYDAETFSLPVRLGLLNATGKQDLIVHILGRQQRYEAANYANLTMPTNLDVEPTTKGQFASFYATLFDHVSTQHPKTVVTEYSWDAASCDPCPGPTLNASDIATLGGDVTGGAGPLSARTSGVTVSGGVPAEAIERVLRRSMATLGACSTKGEQANVAFTIETSGKASGATVTGAAAADPKAKKCIEDRVGSLAFPAPTTTARVTAKLDFVAGLSSFSTGMTLTRLHLRYDKAQLSDDLVFKVADPIVGGREWQQARADGGTELERGARPDTTNNFQSRYVIRHKWEGAVSCPNPVRGRWGGPWPDAGATEGTQTATKLAFAKRDDVQFTSFLTKGAAAELAVAITPAPSASAAPAASASAAPASSAAAGGAKSGGCGSCAVGETDGASLAPVLALGALALARFRRSTKKRRG